MKHKIAAIAAILLIASGLTYGQKSKLNIGQITKKVNFTTNNSVLVKNNFSKELSINTKPSFTQFYRDLLITNNSATKTIVSNVEIQNDKLYKDEKLTVSNIYPNPANDYAFLDYKVESSFNSASLTFFNILGKVIQEVDIPTGSDKLRINTSDWESGIYMYQLVIDGKKIATKKLLVRHN